MNAPQVDELDYAAQKVFSTTETARIQTGAPQAPAHDAYIRLLQHIPLDTQTLWKEIAPFVQRTAWVLAMDSTPWISLMPVGWAWLRGIDPENTIGVGARHQPDFLALDPRS